MTMRINSARSMRARWPGGHLRSSALISVTMRMNSTSSAPAAAYLSLRQCDPRCPILRHKPARLRRRTVYTRSFAVHFANSVSGQDAPQNSKRTPTRACLLLSVSGLRAGLHRSRAASGCSLRSMGHRRGSRGTEQRLEWPLPRQRLGPHANNSAG